MAIWSRKVSAENSLQRTYDEAYQNSMQSIMKERNFELEGSLQLWRVTLDQITSGLSTLDGQPLTKAAEKSLLSSIHDIERQCHDRIQFLETRINHPQDVSNPYRNAMNSSSSITSLPPQRKGEIRRVAVGSKDHLNPQPESTNRRKGSSAYGTDPSSPTSPMPSVKDMNYNLYDRKKPLAMKPPVAHSTHNFGGALSEPALTSTSSSSRGHKQAASTGSAASIPLPPAPQPERGMLRTLRSNGSGKSSRTSKQRGASQAATLAWGSSSSPRNSADNLAVEKQRQQEMLIRTAQQAVSSRREGSSSGQGHAHSQSSASAAATRAAKSDRRLSSSPRIPQSQFDGFDDAFSPPHEFHSSGSNTPSPKIGQLSLSSPTSSPREPSRDSRGHGTPPPQTEAQQIVAKARAAAAAKNRPTNRYVVTRTNPTSSNSGSSGRESQRESQREPARKPSQKSKPAKAKPEDDEEDLDEWDLMAREKIKELRGVDENAAMQIISEVVLKGDPVHWDDIAGLEQAKASLKETVVYPFLRPDLFSGLREPAFGMLLFGPPGTGKTMLARAVATESKSTFFSISASSLTSKYMGESEKLVRALFQMAKALAPSIIFIDEIDSILTQRQDSGEHEASRRIKNEFLVQWSDLQAAAAGKNNADSNVRRVLVLGATNLPWGIDEAARRRFVRRQYIPLPEDFTRQVHLQKLLSHQKHALDEEDIAKLTRETDGYSGSDITALAKDAAMGPLRALGDALLTTDPESIRPMDINDFENSMKTIRPSVSPEGLKAFEQWAALYGSSGA